MIVVTVFEPNGYTIWFKNCHRDHIPFTVKGNGNIVFSVYYANYATYRLYFGEAVREDIGNRNQL